MEPSSAVKSEPIPDRNLLNSIKKLFWSAVSGEDDSETVEQEALTHKVTGLRITPASPIASATPKTKSRTRQRSRLTYTEAVVPITKRRIDESAPRPETDDEEGDGEGLFSPAQWRHEEEENLRMEELRRQQMQAEEEANTADELEGGGEVFCPYRFIKSLPPISSIEPMAPSLPTKSLSCKKMSLVLDLDETLVHCSAEPIASAEVSFCVNHCGVDYRIFARRRPHFRTFLETVSKMFEVIIFTASQKVYADKLLNILDPQGTFFAHRLFRESCYFHDGNYLKDLRVLGRSLDRVAIVDNSPQAFGFHVENGIPIESWFEDDNDEELLRLIPFLRRLASAEDVRPLITQQFRIRDVIDGII